MSYQSNLTTGAPPPPPRVANAFGNYAAATEMTVMSSVFLMKSCPRKLIAHSAQNGKLNPRGC